MSLDLTHLLTLGIGLTAGSLFGYAYGVSRMTALYNLTIERIWDIAVIYLRHTDINERALQDEFDRLRGFIDRD